VKKCFKCSATKHIDEFYKHPQMGDGHLNKCKDCTKRDSSMNKTETRKCFICGMDFMANKNEVKRRGGGAKTCSRKCYYKRLNILLEEKYPVKTNYYTIHNWVEKKLGKPQECSGCGRNDNRRYEWANISGKYLQDTSDWKRLCKKCHHELDEISEKAWYKRRTGEHSPKNVAVGIHI
jgi:hypothetical protein